MTEISVVLCTYNPIEAYFARTLGALWEQTIEQADFEVIIVDNRSAVSIATLPYVRRTNYTVIVENRPGLTAAREAGVRQATGDIVVFVDDDNILAADYLDKARHLFSQHPDLGVASGQVLPEYEVDPPSWFFAFEEQIAVRRLTHRELASTREMRYSANYPIGAGMVIRRSLLLEYFDSLREEERIEGRVGTALSSGEDLDIDLFALWRKYRIGTTAVLKLTHIIPPSRTTEDYIGRLSEASTRSAFKINQKWKSRTGGNNVFAMFDRPGIRLAAKRIVVAACSFTPGCRVRSRILRTLSEVSNSS